MMTEEEQHNEIIGFCENAELLDYSENKVVILPEVKIMTNCDGVVRDLLFVPFPHSGYNSKLFFSEKVENGTPKKWKEYALLNRNWWSISFQADTSKSWADQILQNIRKVLE